MQKKLRKIAMILLPFYYKVKAMLLSILVREDALSYVLQSALFPEIVLKIGGAQVGKNVRVLRNLFIHESRGSFHNFTIGDDVFLGARVIIDLSAPVSIGNRCAIGMDVKIITHINLGDSCLAEKYPPESASVVISDDAIINWGVIVNKGTSVGNRVVVLPGSVVSGILKEDQMYAGNPARPIPQKF